ncbi:MAG: TAXI family TRAP transporter solute-binding subunit [Rhodocyclaceae bacterium]
MDRNNRTLIRRALLALAFGAAAGAASAEKIGMETASTASVTGLMPQAMVGKWAKEGVDVQLSMDQTLTKSLLKLAQGQLDASVIPPPAYGALMKGVGPYAKMGEKSKEMAGNVRALFGFPASFFHPMVWADSDIKTWADVKGKRIFIGPPAGVANAMITALVKAGSGLEPTDYTPIKAPWGAATQNFQDGQFDVYVGSFGLGSQVLSELTIARKIRFLPIPAERAEPPVGLGMAPGKIPPKTYPGQVNEADSQTWQTVMMVAVRKDISDDIAYKLTKSYFMNVKDIARTNDLLRHLAAGDPFAGVNMPLHPGAARYFKEAGIAVPPALMAK